MAELTKEQNESLTIAKQAWSTIVEKYGVEFAKFAFNRKINFEREEAKLLKEKAKLEERLNQINDELK